jgi:hypothetical protein
MGSIRSLLTRVERLEQMKAAPRSPFEEAFGSLEAWEADWQASIDAGAICSVDGPVVMACIRRWHREGLWGGVRWVPVRDYRR